MLSNIEFIILSNKPAAPKHQYNDHQSYEYLKLESGYKHYLGHRTHQDSSPASVINSIAITEMQVLPQEQGCFEKLHDISAEIRIEQLGARRNNLKGQSHDSDKGQVPVAAEKSE